MTQEQEQEYKEKIGSPEMEHLQYLMENPTPTPSDTFIEDWENVSTFDYLYLYNPELKNYTSCGVSMKSFIKQRLLQQRQEIEREIVKKYGYFKDITGRTLKFYLSPHTEHSEDDGKIIS